MADAAALDVAGYLRRLGLSAPPAPTAAALRALHRAHMQRVPYTTVDIHMGRRTTVDPLESAARIVTIGRGGYCFHQNGAFGALLAALGFQVRRHRGGVRDNLSEPPLQPFANHQALTVHGAPSADNPAGDWFVDVGLGDAVHEPIPLRPGPVRQGPFQYRLEVSTELDGWCFTHDPLGSFRTMDFETATVEPVQFRAPHRQLSTSPQSPFVQYVIAQRLDAGGADKLIGCTLTRVDGTGTTRTELTDRSDWFTALADVFGLTLADASPAERDRLWRRAYESHTSWQRSSA